MKAILLAGGQGRRLRSITGKLPKPMVPLVGVPVLDRLLELLRRNGFLRLAKQGVEVYYTRESDCELCTESGGSKKAKDLQKRCQIVENVDPDVTISIHQNSYSDAGISGAQVFYYSTSEKSRLLAEQLQEKLISMVDPTNHRAAKANDSYYMLRKTVSPTVIVECGFLSNEKECKKLQEEKYQDKIVEAIYQGIVTFAQMQESN